MGTEACVCSGNLLTDLSVAPLHLHGVQNVHKQLGSSQSQACSAKIFAITLTCTEVTWSLQLPDLPCTRAQQTALCPCELTALGSWAHLAAAISRSFGGICQQQQPHLQIRYLCAGSPNIIPNQRCGYVFDRRYSRVLSSGAILGKNSFTFTILGDKEASATLALISWLKWKQASSEHVSPHSWETQTAVQENSFSCLLWQKVFT